MPIPSAASANPGLMLALPAHGVRSFALIRLGGCHLATVSRDAGRFPVGASYYGPEMTSAQLPSSPAVLPGTHAVRRQAFEQLHERAITLRRAGRSRREIKEILGITSNATLNEALRGEPPQAWTRRPRAKDDLHAQARQLREKGLDYDRRIEGWVRGAMAWPDTP